MEERKGDPRIYIIFILFLACIVPGGIFLGLYAFLHQTPSWYPIVGMILVGIPWTFWFLAYLYRCIQPYTSQIQENSNHKKVANHVTSPPASGSTPRTGRDSASDDSPMQSPNDERRVQFGVVLVMGSNDNSNNHNVDIENGHRGIEKGNPGIEQEDSESSHNTIVLNQVEISNSSRESEMPLRLLVSS